MSERNNIAIQNLSYVREVDNKNLLSGELEKTFNLPHLFLLVSSACKQSLTRFGHRVCNACCASLFASLQANKCVTCGKIALSKQFYPRPLLARRGIVWILCCLFSFNAHATCTPTPDCASIGYTETSCEGDSLKCPFDITKLYCISCDSSFKYDCVGENIVSSVGEACGGKYVSCACSSTDYIFSNGSCICDTSCKVGAIYYSDKTCSSCVDNTKTPIGVVVKDNELVMSQHTTGSIQWATTHYNFPTLIDYSDEVSARLDFNGQNNSKNIVSYFGENTDISTNAGVFCYKYATEGTNAGDWYLPSVGELYTYVGNNNNILSVTFENKLKWTNAFTFYVWSSSEHSAERAWYISVTGKYMYSLGKSINQSVTCFLPI